MGEDPRVIKERNEQVREELASDLDALGEKLDVKKQVNSAKDGMIDKVKEKVGMDTHKNDYQGTYGGTRSYQTYQSGGSNPVAAQASNIGGTVWGLVKERPLGALAFAYGAKQLMSAINDRPKSRSWERTDTWRQARTTRYSARSGYTPRTGYAAGTYGTTGVGVGVEHGGTVAPNVDQDNGSGIAGSIKGAAGNVTDKMSGAGSAITDRFGDATSGVQDRFSGMTDTITDRAPTSTDELNHLIRSNLPMVGIGALALGAIVGLMTPKTRFEDEHLGDIRENLVDRAQEMASQAQDVAKEGFDAAKQQVKDSAKDQMGSGSTSGSPSTGSTALTGSTGTTGTNGATTPGGRTTGSDRIGVGSGTTSGNGSSISR